MLYDTLYTYNYTILQIHSNCIPSTGWTDVHVYSDSSKCPSSLPPSLPDLIVISEERKYSLLPPHDAYMQCDRKLPYSPPFQVPGEEGYLRYWCCSHHGQFLLVPVPGNEWLYCMYNVYCILYIYNVHCIYTYCNIVYFHFLNNRNFQRLRRRITVLVLQGRQLITN